MNRVEHRAAALSLGDPGRLTGRVIRYGETTRLPSFGREFRERVEAGAFGDLDGADITASIAHDRRNLVARTGGAGLTLDDTDTELRAEIEPVDNREIVKAVKRGLYRGLSVEMLVEDEDISAADGVVMRTVKRAKLLDISIVASPQYEGSIFDTERRWLADKIERAFHSDAAVIRRAEQWVF